MSILGLHTLVEDRSQCYHEHEIHAFKETSWFQSLLPGKFFEFHIKNRIETTKKKKKSKVLQESSRLSLYQCLHYWSHRFVFTCKRNGKYSVFVIFIIL